MASLSRTCIALLPCLATAVAVAQQELPPFADVSKNFERVVSSAEGSSLFGLFVNRKEEQMLAELPRGWEKMRFLITATPSGGEIFAGLQGPE